MPAIEGFELSVTAEDVVVGPGTLDGVAIAGATVDCDVAAANTARVLVYIDKDDNSIKTLKGADAVSPVLPATPADAIVIGSCTVNTTVTSAPSLEGRGREGYAGIEDPLGYQG